MDDFLSGTCQDILDESWLQYFSFDDAATTTSSSKEEANAGCTKVEGLASYGSLVSSSTHHQQQQQQQQLLPYPQHANPSVAADLKDLESQLQLPEALPDAGLESAVDWEGLSSAWNEQTMQAAQAKATQVVGTPAVAAAGQQPTTGQQQGALIKLEPLPTSDVPDVPVDAAGTVPQCLQLQQQQQFDTMWLQQQQQQFDTMWLQQELQQFDASLLDQAAAPAAAVQCSNSMPSQQDSQLLQLVATAETPAALFGALDAFLACELQRSSSGTSQVDNCGYTALLESAIESAVQQPSQTYSAAVAVAPAAGRFEFQSGATSTLAVAAAADASAVPAPAVMPSASLPSVTAKHLQQQQQQQQQQPCAGQALAATGDAAADGASNGSAEAPVAACELVASLPGACPRVNTSNSSSKETVSKEQRRQQRFLQKRSAVVAKAVSVLAAAAAAAAGQSSSSPGLSRSDSVAGSSSSGLSQTMLQPGPQASRQGGIARGNNGGQHLAAAGQQQQQQQPLPALLHPLKRKATNELSLSRPNKAPAGSKNSSGWFVFGSSSSQGGRKMSFSLGPQQRQIQQQQLQQQQLREKRRRQNKERRLLEEVNAIQQRLFGKG